MSELLARNAGYGGTIAQMLANQPDKQKLYYAFTLRNMKYGWTLEERKAYLTFLENEREKKGGASYQGFIDNMRKDFLDNASEAERFALQATIAETQPKPTSLPKAKGPGKDWSLEEITALTANGLTERDFQNGQRTYAAARCVLCHRFGGEGGATGPDLTNVAGRFSFKDLAESLIDPSKVISDQYRASKILTTQGQTITGRIANETDGVYTILTDPEDATKVQELKKSDIEEMAPSTVSLMPKDLLKTLNKEEVLDLLAYLQSRGNPNDPMFKAPMTKGQ
jgi:putative heme-binding domain-containing protein